MAVFDKENNQIYLDKRDFVVLTKMGHITEVQYTEKRNNKPTIKKLNKTHFVVLSSGEVKEFKQSLNRSDNSNSLRKTFKKLRYLINNNFFGYRNELFLTLTYAENVLDTKRVYDDFRKFMQRLKYRFKELGNIEYLDVIEPQSRGAWHHHVLIKFTDQKNIFIENKLMAEIWGHGFVRLNRIYDIDNIGAYLTAYLADIPLSEIENSNMIGEIVEKQTETGLKKFVKGGRLSLYPSGVNLYRKSKGIIFPERTVMTYDRAKKIIGNASKTMESNTFLEIDDYKNHIRFEQYNSKRT